MTYNNLLLCLEQPLGYYSNSNIKIINKQTTWQNQVDASSDTFCNLLGTNWLGSWERWLRSILRSVAIVLLIVVTVVCLVHCVLSRVLITNLQPSAVHPYDESSIWFSLYLEKQKQGQWREERQKQFFLSPDIITYVFHKTKTT